MRFCFMKCSKFMRFPCVLPKANLTSHSRMSGSRWVIHHRGYLGHEDLFCIVLLCILAWRIPGKEEPSGLPSMGSHRVGHDWSDLAVAGLPVHHQLPEITPTHVHQVVDAIQPSHPLSSPSPPAPNPSQHQSLFQWVNSSHEVAKVLEFQL